MNTINRDQAHKQLSVKHNTMLWETDAGRVSVRKTAGRYVVRVDDYFYGKTLKSDFATLAGALVKAEAMKEYYL